MRLATYWTIGKDPDGFEVVTLTNDRFLSADNTQIQAKFTITMIFETICNVFPFGNCSKPLRPHKNRPFVNVTTSKPSGSFPIVQYVGWLTELVLTRSRWADSTYDLVTYFRKNFCASRFPKFCYFWDYSTSRSGTFIFDQTKKYLFTREIWNFKVGAYLLPQPVMSEVSIGNPIQTWTRRNIFYCIPYRKWTQILFPKLIFRNFEVSYLSDE